MLCMENWDYEAEGSGELGNNEIGSTEEAQICAISLQSLQK